MSRFIHVAFFLLLTSAASGQILVPNNLTTNEVKKLLQSLNGTIEDTARIDILMKLTGYHFRKNFQQPEMDSAGNYIRMAKEVNARQVSRKRDGRISLLESFLQIRTGNKTAGKELANKAIRELQLTKDEFYLAKAYLQLTLCYDSEVPAEATEIKNIFHTLFQRAPANLSPSQVFDYMVEFTAFYHLYIRRFFDPLVKLDYLDRMAGYAKKLNARLDEFWARKEITDIHFQQGKLDQAIGELLEIAKEQKAGNYERICYTYDLLSGFYIAAGNHERALYYAFESTKHIRNWQDSFYLTSFYSRIATIYSETGSLSEAVEWNLKRMNYLIATKFRGDDVHVILPNIVNDLIKLNKPEQALTLVMDTKKRVPPILNMEKSCILESLARCYAALNKNAIAEQYCEELDSLTELRIRQKEIENDEPSQRFLSKFYLSIGKYEKAEKHFNRTYGGEPNPDSELSKHQFLYALDSARGNYVSAMKHQNAYHALHDSIFSATKSKQIEELKISYATEQKDQLLQLKEKDNQLQKTKLEQGAVIRNIIIAVVVLLIIIMGLLYNRYRLKQKTNRDLELQQAEISRQNLSLQQLVNEKEWLLKEIHHRVKNNLQIVMSLLNSQSAYINNEMALAAIDDSRHRVHAMSIIHQKLYSSENVSSIDMSVYIPELVSYLADSFNTRHRIRFEYAIEPIEMDVNQAIPLGLILNEAITNAIKYAFPGGRYGIVHISLSNTTHATYLLTISDNGIGMPDQFTVEKPGSLGMKLMSGLSGDLNGKFSIENNNGTTIKTSFVRNLIAHDNHAK